MVVHDVRILRFEIALILFLFLFGYLLPGLYRLGENTLVPYFSSLREGQLLKSGE
jgi:hypothetical protein